MVLQFLDSGVCALTEHDDDFCCAAINVTHVLQRGLPRCSGMWDAEDISPESGAVGCSNCGG